MLKSLAKLSRPLAIGRRPRRIRRCRPIDRLRFGFDRRGERRLPVRADVQARQGRILQASLPAVPAVPIQRQEVDKDTGSESLVESIQDPGCAEGGTRSTRRDDQPALPRRQCEGLHPGCRRAGNGPALPEPTLRRLTLVDHPRTTTARIASRHEMDTNAMKTSHLILILTGVACRHRGTARYSRRARPGSRFPRRAPITITQVSQEATHFYRGPNGTARGRVPVRQTRTEYDVVHRQLRHCRRTSGGRSDRSVGGGSRLSECGRHGPTRGRRRQRRHVNWPDLAFRGRGYVRHGLA